MGFSKRIIESLIVIILMLPQTGTGSTPISDNYIPLSSILVQGAVNIETDAQVKENTLISLSFTLGSDTNGILPAHEDVTIGFRTVNKEGDREECFVIYIPAYSFEKIKDSYEIYDSTNPAETGIKILILDENTGEVIKDLSDSLSFFHSMIIPVEMRAKYSMLIDAIFEFDNIDITSLAFIGSSTKSVLIVGDDSGSALAQNVDFIRH